MADKPTSAFGTVPDTSSLEAFEATQPAQPEQTADQMDAAQFAQELLDRPMPTPTPVNPPGYDPRLPLNDLPGSPYGAKLGEDWWISTDKTGAERLSNGVKRLANWLNPNTASEELELKRLREQQKVTEENDKLRLAQALRFVNENGIADLDPEKAKNAVRIALATQMDTKDVLDAYDYIKPLVDNADLDWFRMARRYPVVASWLVDPAHMKLAANEYDQLTALEKWFTGGFGGSDGHYIAPLAPKVAAEAVQSIFHTSIPKTRAELFGDAQSKIDLLTQQQEMIDTGPGKMDMLAGGFSRMIGYMAADVAVGRVPGAIIGGAIGSFAGPGGTAAGAAIGSQAGSFLFNLLTVAGDMKEAIRDNAKAKNYNLDDDSMEAIAWGGSLIYARLAAGGLGHLGKDLGLPTAKSLAARFGISDLSKETAKQALKERFGIEFAEEAAKTMAEQLPKVGFPSTFGKAFLKAEMHSGVMFGAMQAVHAATIEASNYAATGDLDSVGADRVMQAAWGGFKQGVVDFAILAGVGAGRTYFSKVRQYQKDLQNLKALDDFAKGYKELTLKDESPEATTLLIQEMMRRNVARDSVWIVKDMWEQIARDEGTTPEELFQRLTGLDTSEYGKTAMVKITMDQYGNFFARKGLHSKVFWGLSFDGERTMTEISDRVGQLHDAAAAQFTDGERPARMVTQLLEQAFTVMGEPLKLAKANARVWAWWMALISAEARPTMGDGYDALAFLRSMDLSVAPFIPRLRPAGDTAIRPFGVTHESAIKEAETQLSKTQAEKDADTARRIANYRIAYGKNAPPLKPGAWTEGISPDLLFNTTTPGIWRKIRAHGDGSEWLLIRSSEPRTPGTKYAEHESANAGLMVRTSGDKVLVYTARKGERPPDALLARGAISKDSPNVTVEDMATFASETLDGKRKNSWVITDISLDLSTQREADKIELGDGEWVSSMEFIREAYAARLGNSRLDSGERIASPIHEGGPGDKGVLGIHTRRIGYNDRGYITQVPSGTNYPFRRLLYLARKAEGSNTAFHEMVHFAVDSWTELINNMGDNVPDDMGRRYIAMLEWMGYPVKTADGKYITPYEASVVRGYLYYGRAMAAAGQPFGPPPPFPIFKKMNLSDGPAGQAYDRAISAVTGNEEKIAEVFTDLMKTGMLPESIPVEVRKAWDTMAKFVNQVAPGRIPKLEAEFQLSFREGGPGTPKVRTRTDIVEKGWGPHAEAYAAMNSFFAADTALEEAAAKIVPTITWAGPDKPSVPGKMDNLEKQRQRKAAKQGLFSSFSREIVAGEKSTEKTEKDAALEALATLPMSAKEEARHALLEMMRKARNVKEPGDPSGRKSLKASIGAERERMTRDVQEELLQDPTFQALLSISTGRTDHLSSGTMRAAVEAAKAAGMDIRINREEFRKLYGPDVEARLPSVVFAKKEGKTMTLDEIASMYGVDRDTFVQKMVDYGHVKKFIDGEVQSRLLNKFGEVVFDPDSFSDLALGEIFRSSSAIQQGIEQLRYLAKLIGKEDFNDRAMTASWEVLHKQAVENGIGDELVRRMDPEAFARMANTAWKHAFAASQVDDLEGAFNWKQKQLWYSALYLAAREKREQLDAIRYRLERRTNTKEYRARLGQASSDDLNYSPVIREAHDSLLEALGFRVPDIARGEPNLRNRVGEKLRAVNEYAKEKQFILLFDPEEIAALADDISRRVVPAAVESGGRYKEWNYLTVRQAELVDRVVKQLHHFAKLQNLFSMIGKEQSVKDMVGILARDVKARNLKDHGGYNVSDHTNHRAGFLDRLTWQAADATMTEVETMMRMVSPELANTIFDGFREARAVRNRLGESVLGWWHQNFVKEIPEAIKRQMDKQVPLKDYLPLREGIRDNADRLTLYMIALNMGNSENKYRLLNGYKWHEADVMRMLNDHLTAEEWKFIQSTWDLFDKSLWPMVKAKTERQTGLTLPKVGAEKLQTTTAGELRGGYFPIAYNPDLATRLGTNITNQGEGYYYKPGYSRETPFTFKGHTKPRVEGFYDTVDLNWHRLSSHLVQVVHDIAFDEYVQNVGRLFQNKEFMDLAVRYMGHERAKQLNPWLWSVANGYVDSIPMHQKRIHQALGGLRDKFVIGIIGHSLGVAAADLTNPFVAVATGRISPLSLSIATAEVMRAFVSGSLESDYETLKQASPVIEQRATHRTLRVRSELAEPARRSMLPDAVASVRDRISDTAFILQEKVDKYSSVIIWKAAFRDAKERKGLTGDEAIRFADRQVEDVLPALEKMSQSSLLRDPSFLSSMLIFHGYFNKLFQIARGDFHEDVYLRYRENVANGWDSKGHLAKGALGYSMSMFAMLAISQTVAEWMSGRGQDDDETMWEYLARRTLSSPFSLIPYAYGPAEIAITKAVTRKKRGPGGTSNQQMFSFRTAPAFATVETLFRNVQTIAGGGPRNTTLDEKVWAGVELALYANRLPARQWRRSGEFIADWLITDETHPKDVWDVASGIVYGTRKHQPSNMFRYVGRGF